jgi:hypothetical protein
MTFKELADKIKDFPDHKPGISRIFVSSGDWTDIKNSSSVNLGESGWMFGVPVNQSDWLSIGIAAIQYTTGEIKLLRIR